MLQFILNLVISNMQARERSIMWNEMYPKPATTRPTKHLEHINIKYQKLKCFSDKIWPECQNAQDCIERYQHFSGVIAGPPPYALTQGHKKNSRTRASWASTTPLPNVIVETAIGFARHVSLCWFRNNCSLWFRKFRETAHKVISLDELSMRRPHG